MGLAAHIGDGDAGGEIDRDVVLAVRQDALREIGAGCPVVGGISIYDIIVVNFIIYDIIVGDRHVIFALLPCGSVSVVSLESAVLTG